MAPAVVVVPSEVKEPSEGLKGEGLEELMSKTRAGGANFDNSSTLVMERLKGSEVNLRDKGLGDAGASVLAEALKVNAVLTDLNLQSNRIGDKGATALAEALKVNAALNSLHLTCNEIGPTGAIALAEGLESNAALDILYLRSNEIGDVAWGGRHVCI